MIVPLSTFATEISDSTGSSGCALFVTYLNPNVTGNNQTIFGSQFFTNYYGLFVNNFNTTPVTQTVQMYTAQNALSTTLLSAAPRSTGSDVFPQPAPTPETYSKGLVIGLGCAGGALLLGLIIVIVCLVKQKKKTEELEVVYAANASERGSSSTPLI